MDLVTPLLVVFGLIALLIGAFCGGFICTLLVTGQGVAQFNKRLTSIEMGDKGQKGVEVRQEKAERMSLAMAKVVGIMKDEAIPKEEKMKHVLSVAGEFPDVAFDLVKKVGLKGLM